MMRQNGKPLDLIILSGLSGSGKTLALQSLEDIGYFCIDNLPAPLLKESAALMLNHDKTSVGAAFSIDSRNQAFLTNVGDQIRALEEMGLKCRILVLETSQDILCRRYSESRRRHPLSDHQTPLVEAIENEHRLLQPLFERAHRIINTNVSTPHELRAAVRNFAGAISQKPLVLVESFGFKYGAPLDMDFIFDVRCLPNPHWDKELRPQSGLDEGVQMFLLGHDEVRQMRDDILGFLERWLPSILAADRSYVSIGIGCTGGRHRSVYLAEEVSAGLLSAADFSLQTRHRDIRND